MFSDNNTSTDAYMGGVPVLTSGFERAAPLSPRTSSSRRGQKRKKSGVAPVTSDTNEAPADALLDAPPPPPTTTTAKKKEAPLRLSQLSKAEYAMNVGARLAADVPEDQKEARVLEARDYRGIHLYADPQTGVVYNPDDIMAGVIDPRPLDPELVERLGPWVPSTGLRVAAAAATEALEYDDE